MDQKNQNDTVVNSYKLEPRFTIGSSVKVKEYLDYDEDGQAVVGLTRLAGIVPKEK